MSLYDDLIANYSGPNATGTSIAALRPQDQSVLATNAVGGALEGFGGFMGAMSHVMYGIEGMRAAQFQAGQLHQQANASQATAERDAYGIQRQTDMVTSRALAVAAASGGGASDPTVVNIIARDAAQGAYQKAAALYQGQDRARYLNTQASAQIYQGKAERLNSMEVGAAQGVGGVASILRSQERGASLYSRFAGNGPPTIPDVGLG